MQTLKVVAAAIRVDGSRNSSSSIQSVGAALKRLTHRGDLCAAEPYTYQLLCGGNCQISDCDLTRSWREVINMDIRSSIKCDPTINTG